MSEKIHAGNILMSPVETVKDGDFQIRIDELARELEVKAKAILDYLPEVGVAVKKTYSSLIDLAAAEEVRKHFRALAEAEAVLEAAAVAEKAAKEAAAKAARMRPPAPPVPPVPAPAGGPRVALVKPAGPVARPPLRAGVPLRPAAAPTPAKPGGMPVTAKPAAPAAAGKPSAPTAPTARPAAAPPIPRRPAPPPPPVAATPTYVPVRPVPAKRRGRLTKKEINRILVSYYQAQDLYQRLAKELHRILDDDARFPADAVYTVKHRLKDKDRLIEKIDQENLAVKRLHDRIGEHNFQQRIEDLLGFRIVCLRFSDLKTLKTYLRLLEDEGKLRVIKGPIEKKTFLVRPGSSEKGSEKRDMQYTGYSSIHYVVRLGKSLRRAQPGLVDLKVELQLRTIFEEALTCPHFLVQS